MALQTKLCSLFQPCVMFCGHPSLRFGDVIHFIELWGNNPNNTIVFTGKKIWLFVTCKKLISRLREIGYQFLHIFLLL
jgi:hypothetical protein